MELSVRSEDRTSALRTFQIPTAHAPSHRLHGRNLYFLPHSYQPPVLHALHRLSQGGPSKRLTYPIREEPYREQDLSRTPTARLPPAAPEKSVADRLWF